MGAALQTDWLDRRTDWK